MSFIQMAAAPPPQNTTNNNLSLVSDCGEGHSPCGYCKSDDDTSCSHGMQADFLTVEAYQQLLDRGWRRSGRWVYRPVHQETCCQLLTIRLNVHKFTPNREQNRVQRKWNSYLSGDINVIPHAKNTRDGEETITLQGSSPKRPRDDTDDEYLLSSDVDNEVEFKDKNGDHGHINAYNNNKNNNNNVPRNDAGRSSFGIDNALLPRGETSSSLGGGKRQRSMSNLVEFEVKNTLVTTSQLNTNTISSIQTRIPNAIPLSDTATTNAKDGAVDIDYDVYVDDNASPTAALTEKLQSALGNHHHHKNQSPPPGSIPFMMNGVEKHSNTPAHVFSESIDFPSSATQLFDNDNSNNNNNNNNTIDATNNRGQESGILDILTECTKKAVLQCIRDKLLPEFLSPLLSEEATPPKLPGVRPIKEKQRKKAPPAVHKDVLYTSSLAMALAALLNRKRANNNNDDDSDRVCPKTIATPQAIAEMISNRMMDDLPQSITEVRAVAGHLNFVSTTPAHLHSPFSSIKTIGIKTTTAPPLQGKGTNPDAKKHNQHDNQPLPRPVPRHFELIMRPSSDSTLPAVEFDLYRRYQVIHHGDSPSSVSIASFRRFLCDSPLIPAPASDFPPGKAPSCGFGSFHQQYWVDGRLVAVGVVDILPKCLSSKYLFWDPELASLSLGKVTSLKEIEWIKEANRQCSTLKYYYLGYYIHTCHRMRYKADFAPSDLLCPVNQCWVPIERVTRVLASGEKFPNLCAVEGVFDGLIDASTGIRGNDGGEHDEIKNSSIEQQQPPPRNVNDINTDEVLLFISMPGSNTTVGGGRGTRGGAPRRGQVIPFGTLCALGVLRDGVADRLRERLGKWIEIVGPVWRSLVYSIS